MIDLPVLKHNGSGVVHITGIDCVSGTLTFDEGPYTRRANVKAFGAVIGQHQYTKPGKDHSMLIRLTHTNAETH